MASKAQILAKSAIRHTRYDTIMQNKANRRPLAGNPKLEILNPKQDEWIPNDRTRSAIERARF